MKRFFVTGIGTGVGKTIVSAVLTEAMQADYWKPIQTGAAVEITDSETVKSMLSNKKSVIHPEAFCLKKPVSPHEAAAEEKVEIIADKIIPPATSNTLVIEGAGGLLVPLNNRETMLDLIKFLNAEIILVVRHYLGSINHTLLSAHLLKHSGVKVAGIIYNGTPNRASEDAITGFLSIPVIGRIKEQSHFTPAIVMRQATELKTGLLSLQREPVFFNPEI